MASRGRGGYSRSGISLPFAVAGEPALVPILQPPPLYPLTDKKAIEVKCDVDMEYLLLIDRVILDHFNDFSESVENIQTNSDGKLSDAFLWSHMPSELRPKVKTKILSIKSNITNADAELNRLEQLDKKSTKSGEVEDMDTAAEIVEEFDEEMDEGTDYANDYFDNGEMFEDNDDGEGGPVY